MPIEQIRMTSNQQISNITPSLTHTDQQTLMFALPTGRMQEDCLDFLKQAGLPLPAGKIGRKLIVDSEEDWLRYVMVKPTDVPTFVEYGSADLGIAGIDKLREYEQDVYEPLLLPISQCRLSLIALADQPDTPLRYKSQPRVATSYPNLTTQFFRQRGINAEIIELHGSVEIAPLVNLADLVVDLVQTGGTLRANGLAEIRTILESQATLVVNRAAYQLKSVSIQQVIAAMREIL